MYSIIASTALTIQSWHTCGIQLPQRSSVTSLPLIYRTQGRRVLLAGHAMAPFSGLNCGCGTHRLRTEARAEGHGSSWLVDEGGTSFNGVLPELLVRTSWEPDQGAPLSCLSGVSASVNFDVRSGKEEVLRNEGVVAWGVRHATREGSLALQTHLSLEHGRRGEFFAAAASTSYCVMRGRLISTC